jgi:hypothetical protein
LGTTVLGGGVLSGPVLGPLYAHTLGYDDSRAPRGFADDRPIPYPGPRILPESSRDPPFHFPHSYLPFLTFLPSFSHARECFSATASIGRSADRPSYRSVLIGTISGSIPGWHTHPAEGWQGPVPPMAHTDPLDRHCPRTSALSACEGLCEAMYK